MCLTKSNTNLKVQKNKIQKILKKDEKAYCLVNGKFGVENLANYLIFSSTDLSIFMCYISEVATFMKYLLV